MRATLHLERTGVALGTSSAPAAGRRSDASGTRTCSAPTTVLATGRAEWRHGRTTRPRARPRPLPWPTHPNSRGTEATCCATRSACGTVRNVPTTAQRQPCRAS
jgi:hypothetical protein